MIFNIYFVILTFIVILVIIYLSESITTAVLVVSLLTNFLIISSQLSSIEISGPAPNYGISRFTGDNEQPQSEPEDQDYHEQDPEWDQYYVNHSSYTTAYEAPKPVVAMDASESTVGVDSANVLMAQKKGSRDKKCSDGWASKTADYYRYHFNDELEKTEARDWRNQYEW